MPGDPLIDKALAWVPKGATAQVDLADGTVIGPYPVLAMREYDGVLGWMSTENDERGFGIHIVHTSEGDDGEIYVDDAEGRRATIWGIWDETNKEQLAEYLATEQPPLQIHGDNWSMYPGVQRIFQPGA